MRTPTDWRPIAIHQLCAIARMVFEKDPTIGDAEWKERIKIAAAIQGYASPPPSMLADALSRVEKAYERQHGPRGIENQAAPSPPTTPTQHDPPWTRRTSQSTNLTSLADLIKSLTGSSSSAPSSSASPPAESHEARVRRQIAEWRATESQREQYIRTPRGWRRADREPSDPVERPP